MSFLKTVATGVRTLVSDIREWDRKRKLVTDQGEARIERAEIEAREEAEQEAFSEFLDEHRENVAQKEKERRLEEYRDEQRSNRGERTHPMFGDSEPHSSFDDDGFEPEWPLAESSEQDENRRW